MLGIVAAVMFAAGFGTMSLTSFAEEITQTAQYYSVDEVYSSFNSYPNGPIYAGQGDVVAAISTGGTSMPAGLSLTMPENTQVHTDNAYLVIDVQIYYVSSTPYVVTLCFEDGSSIDATGSAYLAYNKKIVSSLEAEADGGYLLYASTGYNVTTEPAEPFNRLIIPFGSFAGIEATESLQKIEFTAQPRSNSVPKFTIGEISVADSVEPVSGEEERIFAPSDDNFSAIGKMRGEFVPSHQYLIYAGNSSSSASNNVTSQVLFKMPDELIDADGLVDVSKLKGIVFDIGSDLTITNDLSVMLFASNDATQSVASTGYAAALKTVIAADGTISTPTSKYFSKDNADSLHMLNFKAADPAAADASFYGTMPEKISPYFALNVPKGKTYYGTSFTINSVKILLDDTIYNVTAEGNIAVNRVKGYAGTEITLRSGEDPSKIAQITINGTPLSDTDVRQVCSETGLKLTLEGDMQVEMALAKEYLVQITDTEGGAVTASQNRADAGERVRLSVEPEGGYALERLTVDGVDVTGQVQDNVYVISDVQGDVTIEPSFTYTGEYCYEAGSIGSLYNSYPGMVWADKDAVSLAVTQEWPEGGEDTVKTVGITAKGIDAQVKNDQYLVISMQVLTNNARSYQFAVNGSTTKENFEYWICDNQWNVTYASGSKVSVPSVKLTNSTLTQITATGFDGMIVLPVSAFGDIEKIESVSIFADLSNLYARFNLYSVALTDAEGFASDGSPQILPEEIIWTAGEENFEFYGNEPDAAKLRYLEKGEVVLEKIMHANGRDALWWTVPEELLDEDGYINFVEKGIKGIVIDLENYNYSGIVFAIRLASAESATLTQFAQDNIWQTSQSNHPGKWIYENGLVRVRSTANFPYDDTTGYFNGQWYIPLDINGLTSLYTGTEYSTSQLPERWQPVLRLVVGTVVEGEYAFKINGIRFVTDDTPYESATVTSSAVNGEVTGKVDGRDYGGTVNNNFLLGSEIKLNIVPDKGYIVESAKYTLSGEDAVMIDVSEEGGNFTLQVTGDIVIQVLCEAKEWQINYETEGGTLSADSPTTYTIEDAVDLEDAVREGWLFEGWYDAEGNRVTQIPEGTTGDITLTARWTKAGCGSSMAAESAVFVILLLTGAVFVLKKGLRSKSWRG